MEYTCPHCGAPIGAFDRKCEYCGNTIPNISDIIIHGNNNRVDIDWYNEVNWFNKLYTNVIWIIAAGALIFIFYLIGLMIWI